MLVVCNGMLRSGSTLQYNFVRMLLELKSSAVDARHAEPATIDDDLLASWCASKAMTVIKMHSIDPRVVALLMDNKATICYVYRDLRHVAASIRRKWNPPWPEILASLDGAVASFDELTNMPGVLVQRYESLITNEVEAVQQIAEHLGLDVTPEEFDEIVAMCSPAAFRELATDFTARQKFFHSINAAGRRLPLPVRLALRRAGVISVGRKLGISQFVYDQRTLLHPDHITSDPSMADDKFRDLSDTEITELNTRYAAFLKHGNYAM